MYRKPTQRVSRPGRLAALALAVVFSIGAAAHAAPSPSSTPTFDPNNPEDVKLQQIFERFDGKRDAVEAKLHTLEGELAAVEKKLIKLRAKLAKSEALLKKRKAELTAAIAKVTAQKALLKDSVAQIYMRGPFSYIDAILNAEDISSLMRVDVYSQAVLGDFVRILGQLRESEAIANRIHTAVRKATLELRKQTSEVETQEMEILQKQQQNILQRQQLINGLVSDFGGLDELKAHGFDVILRSFAGTSRRITIELAEAQKDQEVAELGDHVLLWPVEEHRITSRFGWRIHPVWGYRSFHTGIDIGSPYGAPMFSVADGVVVDVGYMGAYGLTVVIDNGNSIGTVYAHMSRTRVEKGDRLKAGDQIGNIGCTGWCTGPHVHFEVLLDQKPVNPVYWLS